MNAEKAYAIISDLMKRWKIRQLLGNLLLAMAIAAGSARLAGIILNLGVPAQILSALLAGGGTMLFLHRHVRKITLDHIALHLNRRLDWMEESCQLLFKSSEQLPLLAKMQRRRLLQQFDARAVESQSLPALNRPASWLLTSLILVLFSVAIDLPALGAKFLPITGGLTEVPGLFPENRQRRISPSIQIAITPPAYTGRSSLSVTGWAVEAPAGSMLQWTLHYPGPLSAVYLVFGSADTLHLARLGKGIYRISRTMSESSIYSAELIHDGKSLFHSGIHKINVLPDRPPEIYLSSPQLRTEFTVRQPAMLNLQGTLGDDYGITRSRIVATLSEGQGENIRFRERVMDFDHIGSPQAGSQEFYKVLNLHQLGMVPGAELFFYIEAWDNRTPLPNVSRSEVYFAQVEDTSRFILSSSEGLGIDLLPAYFRSQRQIIIDTERLIRDREVMASKEFRQRSNSLAQDQKLLRLRYGKFLGEEFTSSAGTGTEAQPDESEDGHDHEEHAPVERSANLPDDSILEDFVHFHDQLEEASFFALSIKEMLRQSLSAMWDAELQLRLAIPVDALPHENRALRYLKEVQHQSRAYVKRIGFEPPPLRPQEKRLSGDTAEIVSPKWRDQRKVDPGIDAVRRALASLHRIEADGTAFTPPEQLALERAGRVLAAYLLTEPGTDLNSLHYLRQLVQYPEDAGTLKAERIAIVRGALLRLLPDDLNQPGLRQGGSPHSLERVYFMRLKDN